MTDTRALAACPFCGANAHVRKRSHSMPRPQTFQVQCGECYCGTSDRYETEAYAIAAWNRRPVSTENAELKRQLAEAGAFTQAQADGIVSVVLRDVAELPDRTSPEDQPEMMLVSGEELSLILVEQLSPHIRPSDTGKE